MRGAAALSRLVSLSARVEPLLTELTNALPTADPPVEYALLCALAGVLRGMGKPVGEELLGRLQAHALEALCGEV